ncbi:hypothetical protein CJH73_08325 [Salmonella enterica]|nr:hypothetical protein [Salmonella enterica]EBL4292057.1 hypothetical protein [Salmonella enterica subsp. enterica serovar Rubislaw]EBL6422305.1 hypothetical protein [Salmonella enterica subsp. enterica serovar Give]EDT6370665.1 hypothetical protein [Salmonella enterica subsp. enterica serovar Abaetetuba]EDV6964805.1 hypothetical protein [Salmonella enterica subsp. enterica serovar Minnesota]EEH7186283.1 hypothetical protein [Salmonella enterica subsp. enterica]
MKMKLMMVLVVTTLVYAWCYGCWMIIGFAMDGQGLNTVSVLFSLLGIFLMTAAAVPFIFVLQPVLFVLAGLGELLYQLTLWVIRLIRRRTHA